jgi:hypothetical protein
MFDWIWPVALGLATSSVAGFIIAVLYLVRYGLHPYMLFVTCVWPALAMVVAYHYLG